MFDPLRKKTRQVVTTDPATGQRRVLEYVEEDNFFENGAIHSNEVQVVEPLKCGCITQAAARCWECHQEICSQHVSHCHSCNKPLCGEHALKTKLNKYSTVPMCKRCKTKYERKTRNRNILRFVFSPFVEFED